MKFPLRSKIGSPNRSTSALDGTKSVVVVGMLTTTDTGPCLATVRDAAPCLLTDVDAAPCLLIVADDGTNVIII